MTLPYPTIEALEGSHDFPGRYIIKIIGDHSEAFRTAVLRIAGEVTGSPKYVKHSERTGSKGNLLSITLDVYVQTPHQVQALYVELKTIENVRYLI